MIQRRRRRRVGHRFLRNRYRNRNRNTHCAHLQLELGLARFHRVAVSLEGVCLEKRVSEVQDENVARGFVVVEPVLVQRVTDVGEGAVRARVGVSKHVVVELVVCA
jgi:hypothetical protein